MSEKIYTVNLTEARKYERGKRARKAMNILKAYIRRHTKASPLIGQNLNRELWSLGGKKIPSKLKIKVIVEDDYAKTELVGKEYDEKNKEERAEAAKTKQKKKPKIETTEEDKKEIPKEIKESHKQDEIDQEKKAEMEVKSTPRKQIKSKDHISNKQEAKS